MIVSANIKKYREKNHYSQEELATKMNISRQSISKWERGDALPSVENLIMLSELLDLSLDELILNRSELPLPFDFGKIESKKIFWGWMFFPLLMIFLGFFELSADNGVAWSSIGFGIFLMAMIQCVGFVDLKAYFTYFTVKKSGIDYFYSNKYCPNIIREFLVMFGKRSSRFVNYEEIKEMAIYFNNRGNPGHNTSIAYRPRQAFFNREWLLLIVTLKTGEKIELNLDRLYFPNSKERQIFSAMMDFFESRQITISDDYHVLMSIQNEYDLIEEAYRQKTSY